MLKFVDIPIICVVMQYVFNRSHPVTDQSFVLFYLFWIKVSEALELCVCYKITVRRPKHLSKKSTRYSEADFSTSFNAMTTLCEAGEISRAISIDIMREENLALNQNFPE